ncbi:proline racemase family protein [Actinomadura sp. 3N407]|uniref:proline racemase family protein n=1 Tax=Actinomadura sp. 3N407 TaxID=3457423 RepID=UPI003FCC6D7B
MDRTQVIDSVDVHAEGEPGRILLGGDLQVRGTTMAERLQWCVENLDDLRTLLLREPRGHPAMCGVLVLPPVTPGADVALIILEHGGFRPMSGSNTMCAVTALLETGSLPARSPETLVRIDTAAGLVEATATVADGKVRAVSIRNVPSWAVALDTPLAVPEYGTVLTDVAFGGQFFVQAPAATMGIELGAQHAPEIVRAGTALLAAARAQIPVSHPDDPNLNRISLAMLHGPADEPGVSARNSVILPNGELDVRRPETWRGSLDRSPCGTGTSARMACLHARGELALGVPFIHQGVLGTTFEGMLHERVRVGGRDAVIPSIKGRAWITGINQHVLHPDDPFPRGYTLADVWGESSR